MFKGWRTIGANLTAGLAFFHTWDQLTQWVSPQMIAEGVVFVNLLLRLITTTPVGGAKVKKLILAFLMCLLPLSAMPTQALEFDGVFVDGKIISGLNWESAGQLEFGLNTRFKPEETQRT